MRLVGLLLSAGLLLMAGLTVSASAAPRAGRQREAVRVTTDGHLRPGHLETIKVKGFPGKGRTWVSFLPTAICEDGCGSRSSPGGPTNAKGEGTFRVRVPGTF